MRTKTRAEPLAPDDRRKAIVEAVIPVLLERGGNITTAEIAAAAGIAEGTIFRVFPDKSTLLYEAIKTSFDPATDLAALADIERHLPLEIKLRKAAAVILKRAERVHSLVAALRSMPHLHATFHDTKATAIAANSAIFDGLTTLFDEELDGLVVAPARAAAAFRGLLHAVSFPMCHPDEMITADEAVAVLLHGVVDEEIPPPDRSKT